MRDFRKYDVWKKAHYFAIAIYQVSKSFPKTEQFGITSQIRRASLSIPTNIVEGCSRNSEKEFAHFLSISAGSAAEVEYLLEFSKEIDLLPKPEFDKLNTLIVEVRKMLNSLHRTIKQSKK